MPSLASGNCCCTACASTCAAEWRMTLRPSSVSAATASTSTSTCGVHDRSRRWPSASRTTTIASEPLPGRPASRTAVPAVVPAGTTTRGGFWATAGRDSDTVTPTFEDGDCGSDVIGAQDGHDDRVVEDAVPEQGVPQAALLAEAELLVDVDGPVVEVVHLQVHPVQAALGERVVQHVPDRDRSVAPAETAPQRDPHARGPVVRIDGEHDLAEELPVLRYR